MVRVAALLVFAAPVACGGEPDPVAVKLDRATDSYKAEMKAYREKATAWLDAREATARKAGDKRAVDRIREEQRVFRVLSDLPRTAPEELRGRQTDAKAKFVKAHTTAIKEWTRVSQDKEAAAAEKQLARVRAGIDLSIGRRRWAHDAGEYWSEGKGRWIERAPDGGLGECVEVERVADYVELTRDAGRTIIRLADNEAVYSTDGGKSFHRTYSGTWRE